MAKANGETQSVQSISKIVVKPKKKKGVESSRALYGVIFALPWILGLLIFYAYPLISSIFYSFTVFKGFFPQKFIGLQNYKDLMEDKIFWISVRNTFIYAALSVPTGLIVGVILAVLLNVKSKLQGIYRVIAFVPTLMPVVAVGVIWQWLLNTQYGLVNFLLDKIGINGPPWFGNEYWAKPSLVMIAQWTIGTTVLTYLAGLQDIPGSYYEAAEIDGAGSYRKFISITLPLLSPVLFFNVIMGIIGAFQQFTLPFIVTNGSGTPANSMMFYNMLLYKNAFSYFQMGRANAMAWMMFMVIMGLTLFVYRTSSKWVHYMGE